MNQNDSLNGTNNEILIDPQGFGAMLHRQKENPRALILGTAMIHPTRSGLKITDHEDSKLATIRNVRHDKFARVEGYERSLAPTERSGPHQAKHSPLASIDTTPIADVCRKLLAYAQKNQEIGVPAA